MISHYMIDLDRLRAGKHTAQLHYKEAVANARACKTLDEWKNEIPEVRSFPFATDGEVEAERQRMKGMTVPNLLAALRGRFNCHDLIRLDDQLCDLKKTLEGRTGEDATPLCDRKQALTADRHLAAALTMVKYLDYLQHRGATPARVRSHIKEQVRAKTSAELAALCLARKLLTDGEREHQARAMLQKQANRKRHARATLEACAPWVTALELQTMFTPLAPDERDIALVRHWDDNCSRQYPGWPGYLSARLAERIAVAIYGDRQANATDLSILQITNPGDKRWTRADILDSRGMSIDVKNARRSIASPNTYSEYCVPAFKHDRSGQDVTISAFLSPYVKYERDEYSFSQQIKAQDSVVWLGETSRCAIERLRQEFSFFSLPSPNRLPPWIFDYPDKCYVPREAALAALREPSFPWPTTRASPGAYILAGQVAPELSEGMQQESAALARRIERLGLSRPVLFLHVLDRFCCAMREGRPFPTQSLRDILWPSRTILDVAKLTHLDSVCRAPMAVADPLETVRELLKVLADVAQACSKRVLSFDEFRLTGIGIFKGRRGNGRWTTLFAYCGGWRTSSGIRVPCGKDPLYLGQDATCDACEKLACSACGHCSDRCPDCKSRQLAVLGAVGHPK